MDNLAFGRSGISPCPRSASAVVSGAGDAEMLVSHHAQIGLGGELAAGVALDEAHDLRQPVLVPFEHLAEGMATVLNGDSSHLTTGT